jgi:Aspartyl/Asparaginyl beta-hydroxylase
MWQFTTTYYKYRPSACLYNATCMHYRHHRRRRFSTFTPTSGATTDTVGSTNPSDTGNINHPKTQEINDVDQRKKGPVSAEIHKGPAILLTSHSIRSRPQPNLLYIPGLRSLPYWTQQQMKQHQEQGRNNEGITNRVAYGDPTITAIVEHFDQHYETIRHEYQSNYYCNDTNGKTTYVSSIDKSDNTGTSEDRTQKSSIKDGDVSDTTSSNEHDMHLLNKGGKWDWLSYMTKGNVLTSSTQSTSSSSFHQAFPQTSSILEALRSKSTNGATASNPMLRNQLLEHLPFGYVFFSTLHEQTHILPHTSPINFRLRIHVPLFVPKQVPLSQSPQQLTVNVDDIHQPTCGIRVGNTIREWYAGKSLVLDDSYEHEVWNNHQSSTNQPTMGSTIPSYHRVVLLVDIWHPDITPDEREEICYMFQTAKDQGWLSK